ncbi:proteasome accessory factor PafA2 [Actinomycetaceae bacterium WB03_NA08]|uniref:Proteasome accessory factor PafA2 n=1 Tax=Scrofimicrobium canadense TaxID=2652290 RepID=A0A6N7VQJ4_9ACTO|nr:depupylase/deamidase Dop [Scrofimicrobium canadense]MSS84004.1 proteasome accessory factor PafA2 [Scrofimicrobium canadense]
MTDVVIGTETEYGVYRPGDVHANAIALSTQAVMAYEGNSRAGGKGKYVGWDYRGEDPLNDLRGRRLDRAQADPSQLTDDPYHLAPAGGEERIARPSAEELRQFRPTSIVLANGGRLYVDHAHPEYSSPETANARDAVKWDRAGEVIAQRIMEASPELVLVKNNVDGKGATYGAHENYLVPRTLDLDDLIRAMIPFLVTRPIFCGAGRVGLGQRSEEAGFQISQRADYVENDIGLETTFNRPIFNTRDEPHADGNKWRRIHVIGGDANMFDFSIWLKVGTTALVLRAIEKGMGLSWEGLDLADPVRASWEVSRDVTLQRRLSMADGNELCAIDIQRRYAQLVENADLDLDDADRDLLRQWKATLDTLQSSPEQLISRIEWLGKYTLLERQRQRMGTTWNDPRLQAMDLQWADLRQDRGLVFKLAAAGMVERLFTDAEINNAADVPPQGTRAYIRGNVVGTDPELVKASWTSLVYDRPGETDFIRVPIPDPYGSDCVRKGEGQ